MYLPCTIRVHFVCNIFIIYVCYPKTQADERANDKRHDWQAMAGFPQALEIMENLENYQKKFHAWKNHGI